MVASGDKFADAVCGCLVRLAIAMNTYDLDEEIHDDIYYAYSEIRKLMRTACSKPFIDKVHWKRISDWLDIVYNTDYLPYELHDDIAYVYNTLMQFVR